MSTALKVVIGVIIISLVLIIGIVVIYTNQSSPKNTQAPTQVPTITPTSISTTTPTTSTPIPVSTTAPIHNILNAALIRPNDNTLSIENSEELDDSNFSLYFYDKKIKKYLSFQGNNGSEGKRIIGSDKPLCMYLQLDRLITNDGVLVLEKYGNNIYFENFEDHDGTPINIVSYYDSVPISENAPSKSKELAFLIKVDKKFISCDSHECKLVDKDIHGTKFYYEFIGCS